MSSQRAWILLQACLVAYLRPGRPFPVLVFSGEQGSAKSTAQRLVRRLIDPNKAALRSRPRSERDLMIAARNGWIASFDNLSGLKADLSDSLCRLATGGGFGTRALFTNDEEELFEGMRPVVLNGIDDIATRGDLLDRAILLRLERIARDDRRAEDEYWSAFDQASPAILGALLDALSTALRRLPDICLDELPRMADFAKLGVAAEPALDCAEGEFWDSYREASERVLEDALDASPIAPAIRLFVSRRSEGWRGSATLLLTILTEQVGERESGAKSWPKTPSCLSGLLRRLAPSLRVVGIEVTMGQDAGAGSGKWIDLSPASASSHADPSPPEHGEHDSEGLE